MRKIDLTKELGITDDLMFQNVMKDPVACKMLLHEILPELNIKELEVHTQERFQASKELKASIMDIWVRDDQGRQYDIEMQVGKKKDLDLRARYYMSKLDMDALYSGEDYGRLRPAYVIFLCPFDPKGLGLRKYEFVYTCKQAENLALATKSEIIYLNSTGTVGEVRSGLQDYFDLMSKKSVPKTEFMQYITDRIVKYSQTSEWRRHKMSVEELLEKTVSDTVIDMIKDAIKGARNMNMSDDQIFAFLKDSFGAKVPEAELKKLLEETK